MASGPPIRRREAPTRSPSGAALRRGPGGPRRKEPDAQDPDRTRERRRLIVGAVVVVVALTIVGMQIRNYRGPARPPAEVERIAQHLRAAGHAVDRVAMNANGGWSVLFDDGEVQWFKSPSKAEAQLHPVRVLFGLRRDPNIVVLELHATVFAIVLSGRRQGSTLELGTSLTSGDEIAAMVRTAVSGRGR